MTQPRAIKVAAVQLASGPDVERNLDAVERTVSEAAEQGAELVVVPEGFAFMGPEHDKLDVAEPVPEGGPILARCTKLACRLRVELVLGGFWERAPEAGEAERVRNACVHVRANGDVAAVYRKIHLFAVDLPDGTRIQEPDTVEPGTELVVTEAAFGGLGLSVCYDVRFPELYRGLVDQGAVAIAVPSAFTRTTGEAHWHVLLRARAIETQAYIVAAAQTGWHFGQRYSYGHALIADPWGNVLAEHEEGEGVAIATVDPERVGQVRRQLPSLHHRRLS